MSKFIKKTVKSKKTTKKVELPKSDEPKTEVIKKGKEFVVCPKCGWKHTPDTVKCRFCGAKIGE